MKITALTPQRGRRKRYNVFLDEEFAFGLDEDEVLRAGLRVGDELSAGDVERLRGRDEASRFYNDALHFLAFRPRSTAEVKRYLQGRGADPATIEATVERLSGIGLVDDAAFARYWIENRAAFSPRGARALQAELRAKGVDAERIDDAIDEAGDDEEARAYEAGAKRARSFSKLDEDEFRKKMYAFLQRRGFDYETVRAVTRRLWEGKTADDT